VTYEELLDKVTNNSELEDCWMTLQKVIQIHRDDYGLCLTCMGQQYPCFTIQLIEGNFE
jgi:hypothetical protein